MILEVGFRQTTRLLLYLAPDTDEDEDPVGFEGNEKEMVTKT